eukprot:TRINITY_DN33298_c0_g1_i1.p1 TRINITY_DN33298_c0_g1~~TRINITY_DN33298_c0_g1_i1.p1  ORF type:complete len:244 (-),score=29.08 TRINITY_DN33298_c0_g1_i1:312-968(-)
MALGAYVRSALVFLLLESARVVVNTYRLRDALTEINNEDACAGKKDGAHCQRWWNSTEGADKDCAYCGKEKDAATRCARTCCQHCGEGCKGKECGSVCEDELDVFDMVSTETSKEECEKWLRFNDTKNCSKCFSEAGKYLCPRTCCEHCPVEYEKAEVENLSSKLWKRRPPPEKLHAIQLNNYLNEPREIYVFFPRKDSWYSVQVMASRHGHGRYSRW